MRTLIATWEVPDRNNLNGCKYVIVPQRHGDEVMHIFPNSMDYSSIALRRGGISDIKQVISAGFISERAGVAERPYTHGESLSCGKHSRPQDTELLLDWIARGRPQGQ